MIEYPGRIFFSRWEKPDKDNGWLYGVAYRLCTEARTLFFKTVENANEEWKGWNVLELHGWDNPELHIVWYKHFGVHPFPEEEKRIVYRRDIGKLEDYEIKDPFLLHHSHKLIPDNISLKNDPLNNPRDRKMWFDRVQDFYEEINKHAIIYHPGAHQKSTWETLQAMKKIEILNLPDEDNPTRITGWKIVEIDPEYGYADFSKL